MWCSCCMMSLLLEPSTSFHCVLYVKIEEGGLDLFYFLFILIFLFVLFFYFLFLEQLGLGLIGYTVTLVTI